MGGGVWLMGLLCACSNSAITSSDELELSLAMAGPMVRSDMKQAATLPEGHGDDVHGSIVTSLSGPAQSGAPDVPIAALLQRAYAPSLDYVDP